MWSHLSRDTFRSVVLSESLTASVVAEPPTLQDPGGVTAQRRVKRQNAHQKFRIRQKRRQPLLNCCNRNPGPPIMEDRSHGSVCCLSRWTRTFHTGTLRTVRGQADVRIVGKFWFVLHLLFCWTSSMCVVFGGGSVYHVEMVLFCP